MRSRGRGWGVVQGGIGGKGSKLLTGTSPEAVNWVMKGGVSNRSAVETVKASTSVCGAHACTNYVNMTGNER